MDKLPKSLTTVTPLSIAIAMALFVTLPFIGFYLGMKYQSMITEASVESSTQVSQYANKFETSSEQSPTYYDPSLFNLQENGLPHNWTYESNGLCEVQVPVPPKEIPFMHPYDSNREPSVTNNEGSGRFWNFAMGSVEPLLLTRIDELSENIYENLMQSNIFYTREEGEGSGAVAGAVAVGCFPNTSNWSNDTLYQDIKKALSEYNGNPPQYFKDMYGNSIQIVNYEATTRWGKPVYDITIDRYFENNGYDPYTRTETYTVFASESYVYEIRVLEGTDQFVNDTAKVIFENLKFE